MKASKRHQSGFSLIELMIGITVGLFILLGASSLMVGQISDHRRLLLETRTEQDMRIVAEQIKFDLKQISNWDEPTLGVWSEINPVPQANPYAEVTISESGTSLVYDYWRISTKQTAGFKLDGSTLRRFDGVTWNPITDPETLTVTDFQVAMKVTRRGMESLCEVPCDGAANCPPALEVRELTVNVKAQATHDERVKRDFDVHVRLPSDRFVGACRGA